MVDKISSQKISDFLDEDLKDKIIIEVLEKTTSTNTIIRQRADKSPEGLVVVAEEQSEGRGRLGRSFFSPGGTGLYISLLLRPEIEPSEAVMITTAAAVAVCEALEKVGAVTPQIKWVNDVFVKGKKVCGILTEASFNPESRKLKYAVLGIGINMYEPEGGFPDEIKNIAGSVFSETRENLRDMVTAYFLNSFMEYYYKLSQKEFLKKYTERCFVLGKEINVICGDCVKSAKALSLDESLGLNVEYDNGEKAVLSSGEISIRTKA